MNTGVALLILSVAAFVFYFGVQFCRAALPNLRQPTLSLHAQVAGRRVAEDQGTGWEPATRHYLTFLLDDGTRREFQVDEDLFVRIPDGGCGQLRTRGDWFRGFTPTGR